MMLPKGLTFRVTRMSEVREQGATRWLNPSAYRGVDVPAHRPTRQSTPSGYSTAPKMQVNSYPTKKDWDGKSYNPKYHGRDRLYLPNKGKGHFRQLPNTRTIAPPKGLRPPLPNGVREVKGELLRALKRGGRGLPNLALLSWGFAAADFLDKSISTRREIDRYVIRGGGWFLNQTCSPMLFPLRKYKYQQNLTSQSTSLCLSGQAIPGLQLWGWPITSSHRTVRLWSRTKAPGGGGGYTKHKEWQRPAIAVTLPSEAITVPTQAPDGPVPMTNPGLNPNVLRVLPSVRPMTPALEPVPNPDAPPTRVKPKAREYAPGRKPRNVKPRGRRPRRRREKEQKTLTKSARIAIALFRGLDAISEASEIIDAFYDALPDAVKRRWEGKARWYEYDNISHRPDQGLTDQAGQYGLDGADWKLQALWHNWHKVDFDQGMANMAVNNIEDKLYGEAYRGADGIGAFGA